MKCALCLNLTKYGLFDDEGNLRKVEDAITISGGYAVCERHFGELSE